MRDKVLITGGFGNLGSWVTKEFQDAGYEVTVGSSRGIVPHGMLGTRYLKFDLMNPESVAAALEHESFQIVVHAGSLNDGFVEGYFWKAYRANVEGTSLLLNSLKKNKLKKFIYFSTFHVYGLGSGLITEETPTNPRNDYATSHLAAEFIVRQHAAVSGIPVAILRLSNGYGHPLFMESVKWNLIFFDLILMAAKNGKISLKSNPNQRRDFVWMGDIVQASRRIAEYDSDISETFNVSLGKSMTLNEFSLEIAAAYREFYGKDLALDFPIVGREEEGLRVVSNKLWERVGIAPTPCVREEALKAFKLLASRERLTL
jgi:UDP-glucose 4-epimerase